VNKYRRFFEVAVIGILAVFGTIALGVTPGIADKRLQENQKGANQPTTVADSLPVATSAAKSVANATVAGDAYSAKLPACAVNQQLSTDLQWSFGVKPQRGWTIYEPLICQIINADAGPATDEFARKLARWQHSEGLRGTGVLDAETWGAMIRDLQSHRIKSSQYPDPDRLVTVASSQFWDPQRPEELRQVERDAYAAYKRMISAAASDKSLGLSVSKSGELLPEEHYLKIISAFRPREYQEQLRKQSPNADRTSLAVNSPHFTGRALDLYVGGEPVSTKDANRLIQTRTPIYRWLVKNAGRFGFKPYFYEPWHWEYVTAG